MHPRLVLLFAALSCAAVVLTGPVRAQESLYTVPGVHVDASGPSAGEALNVAIAQGRAKAFQILYRRLTRQADWGRQPALDTTGLLRVSRGTVTANERRSTTRYVADVTYSFNPEGVARLLRAASIGYAQGAARRILVIPMSPGVTHGPWSNALSSPAFQTSQVTFMVLAPEDDAALATLNFDSASWSDLSGMAVKNHVAEVALVQAVYAGGKITVNIRRLGAGENPAKTSVEVPLLQTVGTTYPVAAQAAVHAIEDLWKSRTAVDFSQRGKLIADVRIASLAQWGEIQTQLAGVPSVNGVTVMAMDMGYARIQLSYLGGVEPLREALGAAGLTLTGHGGGPWMLAGAR